MKIDHKENFSMRVLLALSSLTIRIMIITKMRVLTNITTLIIINMEASNTSNKWPLMASKW